MRKNGNCFTSLAEIRRLLHASGEESKLSAFDDYNIEGCCKYDYSCFKAGKCVCNDDLERLLLEIKYARFAVFAIPVYRGHLCSSYFRLSERLEGMFRMETERFLSDYLSKLYILLVGNKSAGVDQALKELNFDFQEYPGGPRTFVASSREYGKKSINGDLTTSDSYIQDLGDFLGRIREASGK